MQTVVLVIHLMLVAALIGVVLLQRSEGGGLGIGGGGGVGGFMSSRGTTNLLTRTTAVLATGFFATSLFLAWYAGYERQPSSIVNSPAPISAPGAPSTAPGNLLDSLKKPDVPATPAVPAAPAAPQAPQSR